MFENSKPGTVRRRRTVLALAAGVAALGMAGTGAAMAASTNGPATPSKIVAPNVVRPQTVVLGTTVTLAPGGYSSGTVTCPAGTLVWGGGESNSGPGTLVLTDSWPVGDTEWLVYVKNNDPTGTYSFTPRAICR